MRPERTWIEVDLGALVANARTVARHAGRARLLPMVKADAYGLGAVPVARALEQLDPWGFGVATAAEGVALREAGVRRRVLVVAPTLGALETVAARDLTPALGGAPQVAKWLELAPGRPFHVEVDTGMARGGFHWEEFGAAAAGFAGQPGFEGVLTHYHSADSDPPSAREQRRRFAAALAALPRRPALVHAANSAGVFAGATDGDDLVRPGIFLFGGAVPGWLPEPVVHWRARVIDVRWRAAGSTVSYGATYTTRERTCLATIAAGYADGVPSRLSNAGQALLGGRRVPFAGRVTMDMTVLDTGGVEPPPDAVATLMGREGGGEITLDEVAETAGTISYEIITGLSARVERLYR